MTYGDDEPLRGKAVYMIRAAEKAMDPEKVGAYVDLYAHALGNNARVARLPAAAHPSGGSLCDAAALRAAS